MNILPILKFFAPYAIKGVKYIVSKIDPEPKVEGQPLSWKDVKRMNDAAHVPEHHKVKK